MKKLLELEVEKFRWTRSKLIVSCFFIALVSFFSALELLKKGVSSLLTAALFLAAIFMLGTAIGIAAFFLPKSVLYPSLLDEHLLRTVSCRTEQMKIIFEFPLLFCCAVWIFTLPLMVPAATSTDAFLLGSFVAIAFAENALTAIFSFWSFMAALAWSAITGRSPFENGD